MATGPALMLAVLAFASQNALAEPAALSVASNRVAVTTGDKSTVKVFDIQTGKEQWTANLLALTTDPKGTPIDEVSALAFAPGGKTLAVGGDILYHGHVALLDAATGKLLWVKQDVGQVERVSVAFAPDGKTVCAGDAFGVATLLDAKTGESKRTLEAKGVTSVAFSPDGKLVAGACLDALGRDKRGREVRLWDTETGKVVRTIPDAAGAVAFSPDGTTLATAGEGNAVSLWEVKTGKLKRALKGKPAGVVEFSPDGKLLASVEGQAGPVSLSDVGTGERLWSSDKGGVTAVAFSSDGKVIVGWSDKSDARRWDVAKLLKEGNK